MTDGSPPPSSRSTYTGVANPGCVGVAAVAPGAAASAATTVAATVPRRRKWTRLYMLRCIGLLLLAVAARAAHGRKRGGTLELAPTQRAPGDPGQLPSVGGSVSTARAAWATVGQNWVPA